jgi:hypothetical protein
MVATRQLGFSGASYFWWGWSSSAPAPARHPVGPPEGTTRAAGLDGLRIHDLRHTAVALWIAAGANPKEVAAQAGHTSVSFTLDRYGHLYPDSYATLRDRLDALHSSAQERDAEVIELSSTLMRPQQGPNVKGAPM